MSTSRLVRMANDIAINLEGGRSHADALHTMTEHLLRFWAPRMRRGIIAHLHESGGDDLRPLAREAVEALARNPHQEPTLPREGVSDAG